MWTHCSHDCLPKRSRRNCQIIVRKWCKCSSSGRVKNHILYCSDGYTPLLYSAQRGHAEIAKLLIDKGAKLDEKHQ